MVTGFFRFCLAKIPSDAARTTFFTTIWPFESGLEEVRRGVGARSDGRDLATAQAGANEADLAPDGGEEAATIRSNGCPADQVRALVSGFSSKHRRKRWLFVLQAVVDDSGNYRQGNTCLMAGLVAPVEEWEKFSDAWDTVLKEPPAIEFFKMTDAFAGKRQFEGWTAEARDKKVTALAEVIAKTGIIYAVSSTMVNVDYLQVAKGATDSKLNDPFYFLFSNIITGCLMYQHDHKITAKVDFIFDSTDKPAMEVEAYFRQTLFTGPRWITDEKLVENVPIFRDEKTFLPLQAADLFAGQIRNYYERGEHTAAMARFDNIRLARSHFNAKMFKPLVEGTNLLRAYVEAAPPDQQLARYIEVKNHVEQLWAADRAAKGKPV